MRPNTGWITSAESFSPVKARAQLLYAAAVFSVISFYSRLSGRRLLTLFTCAMLHPGRDERRITDISRRNFLRILGISAAAPAALGKGALESFVKSRNLVGMSDVAQFFSALQGPVLEALRSVSHVAQETVTVLDALNWVDSSNGRSMQDLPMQKMMLELSALVSRAFELRKQLPEAQLLTAAARIAGLKYGPGKYVNSSCPGWISSDLYWREPDERDEAWEKRVRKLLEGDGIELKDSKLLMSSLKERETLLDTLTKNFPPHKINFGESIIRGHHAHLLQTDGTLSREGMDLAIRLTWRDRLNFLGNTIMFAESEQNNLGSLLPIVQKNFPDTFAGQIAKLLLEERFEEVVQHPAVQTMVRLDKLVRFFPPDRHSQAEIPPRDLHSLRLQARALRTELEQLGFDNLGTVDYRYRNLEQEWQRRTESAQAPNENGEFEKRIVSLSSTAFNPPTLLVLNQSSASVKSATLYGEEVAPYIFSALWWELTTTTGEAELKELDNTACFSPGLRNWALLEAEQQPAAKQAAFVPTAEHAAAQ